MSVNELYTKVSRVTCKTHGVTFYTETEVGDLPVRPAGSV